MFRNPLDDNKFEEKVFEKECFNNDLFQKDREDLLFKSDRQLTSKNKRILKAIHNIKKHLCNIVDYSKQHCEMCKVMNVTQEPFKLRTFDQDQFSCKINNELHTLDLVPQYLIDKGPVRLCHECYNDSGYDKLEENK